MYQPIISRRQMVGGALVTGLASVLAACGSRPGEAASGGTTAWVLTGGPEQTFRESFDRWNTAHTDRQIATEWFANDAYKEKIRTAVGAGNAPTLLYGWAGGTLADYVGNDQVINLTEATAAAQERIIPSLLDPGKVDGTVYALPNNNAQPVMLYYSRPAFEDVGARPPATWDDLLDLVPRLTAAGYTPFAVAGASQWPYLMWIEYLTDRIGGTAPFTRIVAGEQDAWSDPAVTGAVEKIQELVEAGGFGDAYGSVDADSGADIALVHTGKAAMVLQGSWVYANFLTDAPDFMSAGGLGYTGFPSVEGGTGDLSSIVGNPANYWSVAASSSQEAQCTAIDYLNEELYNDDYIKALVTGGTIPAALDADDAIAASEHSEYLAYGYDMVRNAASFTQSWDQALSSAAAQELLTSLSQAFLRQLTPEQFASRMNATL
ncbi:extracellular solute-binding protein [Actinomyces wuliandei]|uniref:extracellular solute-binding protein n=1 Tax=Actinomyces wuliandei TaxID=2057743 RepID=UPI000FDC0421|nr:extracellular solute-binding protein [Actinomyces wuliandei]